MSKHLCTSKSNASLRPCRICGAPISTGHVCDQHGHKCTDCGHQLDTYESGGITFATCRNDDCRLFGVTLNVQRLATLTEEERKAWSISNERYKAEQKRLAAQRAKRVHPANRGRTIG